MLRCLGLVGELSLPGLIDASLGDGFLRFLLCQDGFQPPHYRRPADGAVLDVVAASGVESWSWD